MEVLILRYIYQGMVPSTGNLETVLLLLTHMWWSRAIRA